MVILGLLFKRKTFMPLKNKKCIISEGFFIYGFFKTQVSLHLSALSNLFWFIAVGRRGAAGLPC